VAAYQKAVLLAPTDWVVRLRISRLFSKQTDCTNAEAHLMEAAFVMQQRSLKSTRNVIGWSIGNDNKEGDPTDHCKVARLLFSSKIPVHHEIVRD
jgi:hypothetical protein